MKIEEKLKNNFKSENGITLIILVVTIIILSILVLPITNKKHNYSELRHFNELKDDLQILSEEAQVYYTRYKKLPVYEEKVYNDLVNLGVDINQINPNDGNMYYPINLETLNIKELNYGKGNKNKNFNDKDIYLMNSDTLTVYYIKGISYKGKKYHVIEEEKGNNVSFPILEIKKELVNMNSIKISINLKYNEGEMPSQIKYKYYIKKSSSKDYIFKEELNDIIYTFDGLNQNTSYDIKVETRDISNNLVVDTLMNIVTTKIPSPTEGLINGNIIATVKWKGATADVTLSTDTGLQIQWQKNSISGNWTTGNKVNVANKTNLYARLWNGVEAGESACIRIEDITAPIIINVLNDSNSNWTKGPVTLTVTASDSESGIAGYYYYYNTDLEGTRHDDWGTSSSSIWSADRSNQVFVVARDAVGNESEPKSAGWIRIDNQVPNNANITFSKTTVELNETFTATVNHLDNSGQINIGECKWILNTNAYEIGTDALSYTDGTFSSVNQTINLSKAQEGTYYLHVLTVDKAGNRKETISSEIMVKNKKIDPNNITWPDLELIAKEISKDSSITNKNKTVTKLGVTLNVGYKINFYYEGQLYIARILGFNHDDLTNKNAYGEVTATGKAGISFEFIDTIDSMGMNTTNSSNGGWAQCNIRNSLLINAHNKITYDRVNLINIKAVNKKYFSYWNSTKPSIISDKVWLLSEVEVFGIDEFSTGIDGEQYALYRKIKDAFNVPNKVRAKNGVSWWLRSIYYNNSDGEKNFSNVTQKGTDFSDNAANYHGISPGFAI